MCVCKQCDLRSITDNDMQSDWNVIWIILPIIISTNRYEMLKGI